MREPISKVDAFYNSIQRVNGTKLNVNVPNISESTTAQAASGAVTGQNTPTATTTKASTAQAGAGFNAAKFAKQLDTVDNQISKTEAKLEAINERLYELKALDNEFGTSNFSAEIEQLTTKSDELGRVLAALDEQRQSIFSKFNEADAGVMPEIDTTEVGQGMDSLQEKIDAVRSAMAHLNDQERLALDAKIKHAREEYNALLKEAAKDPEMISDEQLAKLTDARNTLKDFQAQKKEMEVKVKESGAWETTKKVNALKSALKKVEKTAKNKLKSVAKSVLNYITTPFTKAIKVVDKWTSSIGRIAFYRLIRTALKEVT